MDCLHLGQGIVLPISVGGTLRDALQCSQAILIFSLGAAVGVGSGVGSGSGAGVGAGAGARGTPSRLREGRRLSAGEGGMAGYNSKDPHSLIAFLLYGQCHPAFFEKSPVKIPAIDSFVSGVLSCVILLWFLFTS